MDVMTSKYPPKYLSAVCFILLLLPMVAASGGPTVNLALPPDGNLSTSDNITFACNSTDDENVFNISLYNDINGTFGLFSTKHIMELEKDSNTSLLCRFDNSYTCEDGEEGVNESTEFVPSWSKKGVMINESGTLKYPVYNNIEYDQGTIEFWIKLGFDPNAVPEAWLFSTGYGGYSSLQIFTNYGGLYFNFDDATGDTTRVFLDISAWKEGEWHHIAGIWDINNFVGNGQVLDMFIDGYNNSNVDAADFQNKGAFGNYIYLGSDDDGSFQANSAFDELRISKWPRTAEEINESYIKGAGNHSSESANWTINNIPDGSYSWNCMAHDNESNSNWSSENFTFHIDLYTPPAVNAVNLDPSSEDDIDPGVNVSLTLNVTDVSNVSAVVLQYKAPLAGAYINDTMDFNPSTGLWENGTIITTISDIGNWTYRVWSNDTNGYSGYSGTYSLPVDWDRTWNLTVINSSGNYSASLGTTAGFKGSVQGLGTMIINNTGDYSLNFDLSSLPIIVLVTYNVTEPFDLLPGRQKYIVVNATMPDTPNEYPLVINISSSGANPAYRLVNATVVSFIGGPYLGETTDITDYPASIVQSGSANFTASVKNIGNETASNVWLNWTFPAGWSLSIGNLTNMLGNLSPQESAMVTVTAQASSSAVAGAATIWVNSSCAEGAEGSDFKVLSVGCNPNDGFCGSGCTYLTDDDCPVPRENAGAMAFTGPGGTIVREPEMTIIMPERADITKGKNYNITVNVSNTVEKTNLTNILLQITGYPETLIKIIPLSITQISPNQTRSFTLEISVPPYLEEKDYFVTLTVTATGNYGGGVKSLKSFGRIVFAVHGVMENETLNAIKNAEAALEEMRNSGFNFEMLANILEDAKSAYNSLDFDRANEMAQKVIELRETAFRISSQLDQVEKDIVNAEKYGISAEEVRKMADLAKSAFQRGDYKRAEERITAAVTAYQMETKNILPVMEFFYKYWQILLLLLFSCAMASIFTRKKLKIRSIGKNLEKLRSSKKSVKGLITALQEDYFNKNKISKLEYEMERENYEKRLAELNSEEMRLASKITLAKSRNKKAELFRLKENAENRMKGLQRDYFESRKMGKGEYSETAKQLQAELAEIEKNLGRLEKTKKSNAAAICFLGLLISLMILPCISKALENVTAGEVSAAMEDANATIEGMSNLGLGTEYANHTLEEAKLLFSRGDYDSALTAARYVSVIKQKAVTVNRMVDEAEIRIHDLSKGHNVSEAGMLFDRGVDEFKNENYEKAEALLTQAMDTLDGIEREAALSKASEKGISDRLSETVYENRAAISVSLVIIIIIIAAVLVRARMVKKSGRIKALQMEIAALRNSIKDLQESYFNKGKLGKNIYEARMHEYKKMLRASMEALQAEKPDKNDADGKQRG